eukprot:1674821-Amphidinium_carterae.1
MSRRSVDAAVPLSHAGGEERRGVLKAASKSGKPAHLERFSNKARMQMDLTGAPNPAPQLDAVFGA